MSPLLPLPVLTTWPPRDFTEVSMLALPPLPMELDTPLDSTVSRPSPTALLSLLMSPLLPLPALTTSPSREPSTKSKENQIVKI